MNVQSILGTKGADVATISAEASVADAAAVMRDRGIGSLVVSADGRTIRGIISERDVVRAVATHGAGALGRTVGSVMTADVATCHAADTVHQLMALMTERRIRHLPVVDDTDQLGGIISIGDVVKGRLGELQLENQALTDYLYQGQ